MIQLILNAAAFKCHDTIPFVVVDCDNNVVVSHGNEPLRPFPTNQSQADILCIFKNLISPQLFHVQYKYVQSHANDTKLWRDCSWKEQINIKVDCLAKKTLMAAHSTGKCIKSAFLNEQIWISMGGGGRWRVPWGLSWKNSGAGPLLRSFFTKKELSHLLILTLSGC